MQANTGIKGYLGIDNGTQGLSVVYTDADLKVLVTGEAKYDFVAGLPEGCYEQLTEDWERALREAMKQAHEKIIKDHGSSMQVLSIGISGQMHGQVMAGKSGESLGPVRLWCDARNDKEGHELTEAFGVKIPKRSTAARFLWTARQHPDLAGKACYMTTPAGWMAYVLTGEFNLGIGDSSGMFPIDQTTGDYNQTMLKKFDEIVGNTSIPSLSKILPKVVKAGEAAGNLTESGAELLGIDWASIVAPIPVAPAEGDQVAALAGSLIGKPGMVSCSFGTSVCANVVGDHAFVGVSPLVDTFCAANGQPILMIWLRNGTTFLNTIVKSYANHLLSPFSVTDDIAIDPFASVMPKLIESPPDCGGLLALPFMDDEPGLHVSKGGTAMVIGWNSDNATPGNIAKAALLSTMFNVRLGFEVLDKGDYPRSEIGLTGGIVKTPDCGQILADVLNVPVFLLESADEGCSWGAAVMAKFRHLPASERCGDWEAFLDSIAATKGHHQRYEPNGENIVIYDKMFQKYKKLVELHPQLSNVTSTV